MFIVLIKATTLALGITSVLGSVMAARAGAWTTVLFTVCAAYMFIGMARLMRSTTASAVPGPTQAIADHPFDSITGSNLLALLIGGFLAGTLSTIAIGALWPVTTDYAQALLGFGLYGFMGIGIWITARRHGVDLGRMRGVLPDRARLVKTLAFVIPLLAFSYGTVWIVYYPISTVWPNVVEQLLLSEDLLVTSPDGTFQLGPNMMGAFAIIVLAPVVEETFFRGFLLHRWAHKWGVEAAVVGTSVVFAILHADPLGAAVFGFAMAVIYLQTGSLMMVILCHVLNNLIAYTVPVVYVAIWGVQEYTLADFHREWWTAAVALAFAVPLVIPFVRRGWPTNATPTPYEARVADLAAEIDPPLTT